MIIGKIGVISIEEMIREARLRWFGHIKRSMDTPVRRYGKINCPEYRSGRGRSKKSWNKVIRYNLNTLGLV